MDNTRILSVNQYVQLVGLTESEKILYERYYFPIMEAHDILTTSQNLFWVRCYFLLHPFRRGERAKQELIQQPDFLESFVKFKVEYMAKLDAEFESEESSE